jgi:hypothetical protein
MNQMFRHLYPLIIVMFQCATPPLLVAQKGATQSAMQAALREFAGDDLSKKNGPLAKAGLDLALLREEYNEHQTLRPLARFVPSNPLLRVPDSRVVVDVVADGEASAVERQLTELGMQITGSAGSIVSGKLPIAAIEAVAGLQGVRFLSPAMWTTNMGLTTTQGDVSIRSDHVRSTLGYNGAGVTVGVLSDSYNHLNGASSDVLSGDLPGTGNPNGFTTPVNVLADDGTTDEGRAMLQIIHDVAPGAALAFATANGGQATFANNITNLRTMAGAKVIVDDVIYYAEPMFQDGVIAQAVDDAVAAGVAYFSSAGNQARQSYESTWRSGPVLSAGAIAARSPLHFFGGTTFDFDPGAGVDNMQSFTLGAGKSIVIVLQWDSPSAFACGRCPGSSNDLDIYLLNAAGDSVYTGGATNNINGNPVEIFQYTNTRTSAIALNLMIVKYSGSNPGFLKYVNFGSAQQALEYDTQSSTIYGHANAAGAEAVGAAAYYNTPQFGVTPPVLESYSSAGPTAIRFTKSGASTSDPRADKPEITAPDGTNTTFFGVDISQDADTYPNFFGTSAAAPHAAAVAALMIDAIGTATPAQIYASLEQTAIDMGVPGFDNNSGFGLIQADAAVSAALPIQLASSSANVVRSNDVELVWKTISETNNYGFELYRRRGEMAEWKKVGFVEGHGTTLAPQSYSYIDRSVGFGKYFYQIKQVDLDGKSEVFPEMAVTVGVVPERLTLAQNYPNPFNPSTVIEFVVPQSGAASIKVYNLLGQEVATVFEGRAEAEEINAVRFDASNLPSGMYFYTLKSTGKYETKRMLLTK